jgi:hypothetical protein
LTAVVRFSRDWRALYTTPIAPRPSSRSISYPGIAGSAGAAGSRDAAAAARASSGDCARVPCGSVPAEPWSRPRVSGGSELGMATRCGAWGSCPNVTRVTPPDQQLPIAGRVKHLHDPVEPIPPSVAEPSPAAERVAGREASRPSAACITQASGSACAASNGHAARTYTVRPRPSGSAFTRNPTPRAASHRSTSSRDRYSPVAAVSGGFGGDAAGGGASVAANSSRSARGTGRTGSGSSVLSYEFVEFGLAPPRPGR